MKDVIIIFGGCGGNNIGNNIARKFKGSMSNLPIIGGDINLSFNKASVRDQVFKEYITIFNESYHCDVSHSGAVDAFFYHLKTAGKFPKYVINSAGVNILGKMEDYTRETFDHVLAVNLTSHFIIMKNYIKYFDGNGREKTYLGVTSDTGSFIAKSSSFAYMASKAGANAFLQGIARDLDKYHDDKWNVIPFAPGMVANTPMDKKIIKDLIEQRNISEEEARKMLTANIPKGRGMTMWECAEWVYFLCTKGTYSSGNIIRVDNNQLQG